MAHGARCWGLLLAFLILLPLKARAAEPKVAVLVYLLVNVSDERAQVIAGQLSEAIQKALQVEVLSQPDPVKPGCPASPDCLAMLGAKLQVDELLFLGITKLGKRIRIAPLWSDVRTGSAVSRPSIFLGANAKEFRFNAADLLPGHAARPKPIPKPEPIAKAPKEPEPPKLTKSEPKKTAQIERVEQTVQSGRSWWPIITTGGIAVAALAAGVGLGVSALSDEKRLNEDNCRDVFCGKNDEIDLLKTKSITADVLYGVSAASGVTMLLLYLLLPEAQNNVGVSTDGRGAQLTYGAYF